MLRMKRCPWSLWAYGRQTCQPFLVSCETLAELRTTRRNSHPSGGLWVIVAETFGHTARTFGNTFIFLVNAVLSGPEIAVLVSNSATLGFSKEDYTVPGSAVFYTRQPWKCDFPYDPGTPLLTAHSMKSLEFTI